MPVAPLPKDLFLIYVSWYYWNYKAILSESDIEQIIQFGPVIFPKQRRQLIVLT